MTLRSYIYDIVFIVSCLVGCKILFDMKQKPRTLSVKDRTEIQTIPLPRKLDVHGDSFFVPTEWRTEFVPKRNERILRAVNRWYSTNGIKQADNHAQAVLNIEIKDLTDRYPQLGDDESYILKIRKNKISIKSNTIWGTLHALQTLSQLIVLENGQEKLPQLTIQDSQQFPWRDLMLDICQL